MKRDFEIGFPRLGVAHVADASVAYTTGNLDSEAEVIAAVNTTNGKINLILTALEKAGVVATS